MDDGKSTLIGRLLHDSKMIYEDHMEALKKKDSVKSGTTGEELDLALLVDGLQAEREQGITIDVAYRYSLQKTQVHHRGHPGARAVHPQHGDWRLHSQPGGDLDRRPLRRVNPDPQTLLHRLFAGHSSYRRGHQQDGSGGIQRSTLQ